MIKANTENMNEELLNDSSIDYSDDFNENEVYEYGNVKTKPTLTPEQLERRHNIKTDLISCAASVLLKGVPIIIKMAQDDRQRTGYKRTVMKSDMINLGVSLIAPTVKTVDTLFFKSKLDNKLKEKLNFGLGDVRNIVNMVTMYPQLRKFANNLMEDLSRKSTGKTPIGQDRVAFGDSIVNGINLISPFIVHKLTDSSMTFTEKITSIMPIHMFGHLFRKFASVNPNTQKWYNVVNAATNVAAVATGELSSAVRPTGNAKNATNTIISGIQLFQEATGMSNGNIRNGYGYGMYGHNSGARWAGGGYSNGF